ncbi:MULTISPECIES: head decoration protein [unclassified Luteococcus]|uniref:head decoration protein n=1 Tax=unclassified Luteococcus TaxID=2639923 RepID=UPI00313BB137
MSNFAPERTNYTSGDRRWARNFLALDTNGVTLDGAKFTAGQTIPSGTHIGRITATKLYAKYDPAATDGTEKSVGLLVNDWVAAPGKHLVAVASGGGPVDRRYLPAGHDAAAEADLTAINFIN